jgi:hypothetical protein
MYVKVSTCTTTLVFPSKICLNNIEKNWHTKKFKINEIQNKYQKKEKKEQTKKIWLPEDLNLGAVALETGRLSIGLARGSSSLLCHQLYLTRQRAAFHPRSNKAVSPRSSPKSSLPFPSRRLRFHHRVHHQHHLGPIAPRSRRWWQDDEGDQEPQAISPHEQPEAGPSVREVHLGSPRCGGAPGLRRLRRRGGSIPDVPPGFERVTPNRTRVGGLTLLPAKPKVRFHYVPLFILMVFCISIIFRLGFDVVQM